MCGGKNCTLPLICGVRSICKKRFEPCAIRKVRSTLTSTVAAGTLKGGKKINELPLNSDNPIYLADQVNVRIRIK